MALKDTLEMKKTKAVKEKAKAAKAIKGAKDKKELDVILGTRNSKGVQDLFNKIGMGHILTTINDPTASKESIAEICSIAVLTLHKAAKMLGIPKVLDKYKYREVQIAGVLGHRVNPTSGDVDGDAYNSQRKFEYKSRALESGDILKLLAGKTVRITGIYSGGNTRDGIEKTKKFTHIFAWFYEETPVLFIEVSDSEIVKQLEEGLQERLAHPSKVSKRSGKSAKDDNFNNVVIKVNLTENSPEYKIVWKDDQYFPDILNKEK